MATHLAWMLSLYLGREFMIQSRRGRVEQRPPIRAKAIATTLRAAATRGKCQRSLRIRWRMLSLGLGRGKQWAEILFRQAKEWLAERGSKTAGSVEEGLAYARSRKKMCQIIRKVTS